MKASFRIYLGLFLFTLANLMFEILLTRIFSVTIWYHFAFLAISLTMLGMTAGAIIVYLKPARFAPQSTEKYMSVYALLFAWTSIFSILAHIWSPALFSWAESSTIILVSLAIAIPILIAAFAFGGIVVSLALTRYPAQLDRLYAVDLIGAAIGCNAIVLTLQKMDGISAVFFIAGIACFAAYLFAPGAEKKLKMAGLVSAFFLVFFAALNASLFNSNKPLIKLSYTKGMAEVPVLYQRWNSFSRIRVLGDPVGKVAPFGYFSPALGKVQVRQLYLDIDGCAQTTLPYYDGNPETSKYLLYDPINIAHYLRPDSDVMVIGVGGGRDILSALLIKQKSVTGVEINGNIIKAVGTVFGEFTGHLDKDPRVTIVNDEARSYAAHCDRKYDIILASVVDTWAASASGAFSMTENSLYTTDAWVALLNHLTDTGILTVGRFYDRECPSEFYRLTALAAEALRRTGVSDTRSHLAIVRLKGSEDRVDNGGGVGTILVSKQAFSKEMIDKLNRVCAELKFEVALTPDSTLDPILAKLAAGTDLQSVTKEVPWDISAPTDDKPFFFQTFSLQHIFDKRFYNSGRNRANVLTGPLLFVTAMAVLFFSAYCFRIPYLRTKDKDSLKGSPPLFVYFFSIGLGFMFAEISQIQRFTIFLGHPTYGATVVLFSLLLSTGVGSLLLRKLWQPGRTGVLMAGVVAVLAAFGIVSPLIINQFGGLAIVPRICIAVAVLFPIGLALGLLFPLGMKVADQRYPALTPWMWGMNGAASVCGSVLAVLISMVLGISVSYWCGVLCYVTALACMHKLDSAAGTVSQNLPEP